MKDEEIGCPLVFRGGRTQNLPTTIAVTIYRRRRALDRPTTNGCPLVFGGKSIVVGL